jgi:hypothetical protein
MLDFDGVSNGDFGHGVMSNAALIRCGSMVCFERRVCPEIGLNA